MTCENEQHRFCECAYCLDCGECTCNNRCIQCGETKVDQEDNLCHLCFHESEIASGEKESRCCLYCCEHEAKFNGTAWLCAPCKKQDDDKEAKAHEKSLLRCPYCNRSEEECKERIIYWPTAWGLSCLDCFCKNHKIDEDANLIRI